MRSRKTEGRGRLRLQTGKEEQHETFDGNEWRKRKKELLLTLFDEAEIENDCLRDSSQKDGGSRREITVNLSPLKNEKLGTSGHEQRAPVAFNKIKIAFWVYCIYSSSCMYMVNWKTVFRCSSLCLNTLKPTGTSLLLLQPCLCSQIGSLHHLVLSRWCTVGFFFRFIDERKKKLSAAVANNILRSLKIKHSFGCRAEWWAPGVGED